MINPDVSLAALHIKTGNLHILPVSACVTGYCNTIKSRCESTTVQTRGLAVETPRLSQ